jgi:hypothetical protein
VNGFRRNSEEPAKFPNCFFFNELYKLNLDTRRRHFAA